MTYTGIFALPQRTDPKSGNVKAEYRLSVEAETAEQAFYKITQARKNDPIIMDYMEYSQEANDWKYKFDLRCIENENGNTVMMIRNGQLVDSDKIEKVAYTISEYEVTESILISLDKVKKAVEQNLIDIKVNSFSERKEDKLLIIYGKEKIAVPVPSVFSNEEADILETLTSDEKNDFEILQIKRDLIISSLDDCIKKTPYVYNSIKEYFDVEFKKDIEKEKIQYEDIYRGLKSGYIECEQEKYSRMFKIQIDDIIHFHIPPVSDNSYGSPHDPVALSVSMIEAINDKLKLLPLNVQKEIIHGTWEHVLDKLPNEVVKIASESFETELGENRNVGVACIETRKNGIVCFPFKASEDIPLMEYLDTMNEDEKKALRDFLKPYENGCYEFSVYNVAVVLNKAVDYNAVIDAFDLEDTIQMLNQILDESEYDFYNNEQDEYEDF